MDSRIEKKGLSEELIQQLQQGNEITPIKDIDADLTPSEITNRKAILREQDIYKSRHSSCGRQQKCKRSRKN